MCRDDNWNTIKVAFNLARNEAWIVPRTLSLCDGVLECFQLLRSVV